MPDSVRPQRWQPTRLPCPWDSPGKNTGVGCHFLLQCMKVKSQSEAAQSCLTLSDLMDCSLPGSSIHGIFPGKSTGVGCHCLLCDSKYKIHLIISLGSGLKEGTILSILFLSQQMALKAKLRNVLLSRGLNRDLKTACVCISIQLLTYI